MPIRVPTGFTTLTLEAQRKALVGYRCSKCGKVNLQEIPIKTSQSTRYHVFGGRKARENAEEKARRMVANALDKQDAELFEAINIQRNYGSIHAPVVCPGCGEKQPWSAVPKPWTKEPLFGLWLVGLFFAICFALPIFICTTFEPLILILLLPSLVLLSLPVIRSQKRKKAMAALQETSFQPPKYYNRTNIHELSRQ